MAKVKHVDNVYFKKVTINPVFILIKCDDQIIGKWVSEAD